MPKLHEDPQTADPRVEDLTQRLVRLERLLDKVSLPGTLYLTDGSRPISGPLTHRGPLLGFFSAPATSKANSAALAAATTATQVRDALLTILRAYGLVT